MRCWHIQRPMTRVPIQPTRVLPGCALAMRDLLKLETGCKKLEIRDFLWFRLSISMVIPKLKAPIVLVHGLFGFDRIALAGMTLAHYFPGIVGMLQKAGNKVLVPFLSPMAGGGQRSSQLQEFLHREAPGESFYIFFPILCGRDS